jgi:hypothetical protein
MEEKVVDVRKTRRYNHSPKDYSRTINLKCYQDIY